MILRKTTTILILLLLNLLTVYAQDKKTYTTEWKKIADFEKKGLAKSALTEAIGIFNDAVLHSNETQQIKSAMYQMKYRNLVEEENGANNLFFVDTLIAKAKVPAKNILQSMQAEMFLSFRNNNRYKLYSRTALLQESSADVNTWSAEKLNNTITSLYKASLKNAAILKTTSLTGFDAILQKGENSRQLRPTLYDLLAHRTLQYFMNDENLVTQPAYKFILNDARIFSPANEFIKAKFITQDTASQYYNALTTLQDILTFHSNDNNADAMLDADLIRLAFVNSHAVIPQKQKLYEAALQQIEQKYSSNKMVAQAIYLRALIYNDNGQNYNAFTKKQFQFDIKKAVDLAQSAVIKYPGSEGAINAQNFINEVKRPSVAVQTEKVNVPSVPFRSLVKFKNAPKLYFRVIKTSRDEIKRFETDYNKTWQLITALSPVKSWSVELPDQKDYQEHTVEIKIDGLPAGTYFIVSSLDDKFTTSKNILTRQVTYISNISYLVDTKNGVYALNRDNGEPLANAEIQLWQQKYDYTDRKYAEVKKEKLTTDKNGYAFITKKINDDNYNNFIEVKYKNESLFTNDQFYNYSFNYYEPRTTSRSFLFTDRSIYRPGQTVFFKGIVVRTDSSSKKSTVIANYKTTVTLYNANNEKAGTVTLISNEYGSYNGTFALPEGLLNGNFSIRDNNGSSQSFSVEEYKRPKFFVEIKKPEGTYRVNDSINVIGTAKGYAGNNIDGAKVSYRVVRKIQYPVWYGWGFRKIWPPYAQAEQMEIANGITETNSSGEFTVRFKAIPDESVDKTNQPVFYYEVSADITDVNGETRSSNTTVAVAYQALQLEINTPEKLAIDSLKTIAISSTNLNGIHEKALVNVQLFSLQSPGKIFRERYWEMPDLFVITKTDYASLFPYDVYADEDQPSKWAIGNKVFELSDTTSASGSFNLKSAGIPAGWYKIIVTTKDKFGEEVRAEKYIRLSKETDKNTDEPILINVDQASVEPGEKINYSIQTGFDKIWLIHALTKMDKKTTISYPLISSSKAFSNIIGADETDRGGISLGYAFVQHNRMYQGAENFYVPWNNKELNISYETFRDKLLPGSEEKWTVKISGDKAEKVAAETLVSMYDASLDQFKPHNWNSLKSLWPTVTGALTWNETNFSMVESQEANWLNENYLTAPEKTYDELVNDGWNVGGRRYGYGFLSGKVSGVNVRSNAKGVLSEDEGNQVMSAAPMVQEVKFSPSKVVGDKEVKAAEKDEESNVPLVQNNSVQVRKNFNETALFFPGLATDANGNVSFSFTMPEALTEWKLMTLAHTKELASGYSEKKVITQKPLMVQPNAPRFLREGDQMEFAAKIVNLTDKEITGTAQLELLDAATNKPVDGWFKNVFPNQYFTVAAGQSFAVKFPITIPFSYTSALTYRIKAVSKDGSFSDGEEMAIPVLSNRMLVTETFPINMRNTSSKTFKFDKLLSANNSGSLTNHALTLEYSSNPAWYAVQALPYLMEYPYECAEQTFNRYYANTLASFISNSTPKIKAVFEKWKLTDTAALMSNLEKNQELKSALLEETPWVLEAKNENEQKKNIAMLFDMVRLSKEKNKILSQLKEMQSSNGGFTWFKGGPDDRYMTQYIVTGIGHLRKLNALNSEDLADLKPVLDKAVPYLDARLKEEYDDLLRYKAVLKDNNLSYTAIQYLYMHSFFSEYKVAAANQTAYNYYRGQSQKYWLSQNKYMQAMIALSLNRTADNKTAKAIIASLKENSISNEEMGMYWKELTSGGYYWYQAPIESQAMLIEAFSDIDKNVAIVNDMKTWLLKQKQTQSWPTTKATAEACYALLLGGSNWLAEEREVTINLGNTTIKSTDAGTEAGTGYFKKRIEGDKVQQGMGNITVSIKPVANQTLNNATTSWGAVYWQYFEDLDKITAAATPLKLVKKLYIEKNSAQGPVLQAINDGDELHVGDKIKVRIELKVDRDMEYIHMKDMRAACMEPTNVLSEYKWQGGLGYYESTKDASTNFFFSWLPKGTYTFEYPMFVTHSGNFSNGITSIQSMYAPEFSSHSEGVRVTVE